MKQTILNLMGTDKYCKLVFKDKTRFPNFGKFVEEKDHKELWEKGMIRFIPRSKEFLSRNASRIFEVKVIELVIVLDEVAAC